MVVQKNMAKWHLKGHTAVKGYHYGDKRGNHPNFVHGNFVHPILSFQFRAWKFRAHNEITCTG